LQCGFPIEVASFEPLSPPQLEFAHDPRYVEAVLAGTDENGFGSCDVKVADSLRFTSAAMLAAGRAALGNGRVAVAPASGFHHAGFAFGGGFCTFNGLMITAIALHAAKEAERIGILDLDFHYGNGTDDIIRELGIGYVRHHTSGRAFHAAARAANYLNDLTVLVSSFHDCDLLLYQAGADAHVDDPLGGWMTTAQLRERDRIVFDVCERIGLPVAWNLAGGYRRDDRGGIEPVLEVHRNTMRECVARYCTAEQGAFAVG
jgi:acetoin utilization deacetylase AcuC-like enzyme